MTKSIKQSNHLKKLAISKKGSRLSIEIREKISNSLRKKHPNIVKICVNCGKQFFRNKYPSGVEEAFPKYQKRKYCSLYCARHSEQIKGVLKKNIGNMENNPHWLGGRNKRDDGYIEIMCPLHPYANHNGYVMEHRLVMEKNIKRFLTPKEVVHHINEIRDDNRIENLKIFENTGYHLNHHLSNK